VTFPGVADAAFNQIRQYGRSSVAVTVRLLEAINAIAALVHRPEDRTALLLHANMVERGSRDVIAESRDRGDIEDRFQMVVRTLQQ
jgi:uncharacterized membrane protein